VPSKVDEKRREGQGNENGVPEKERGNNESCKDDRPDADERISGGGFVFLAGAYSVALTKAISPTVKKPFRFPPTNEILAATDVRLFKRAISLGATSRSVV